MASKRKLRKKECGQKVRYETHEAAQKVANRLNKKDKEQQCKQFFTLQPYRCSFCGHLHIGHKQYRRIA